MSTILHPDLPSDPKKPEDPFRYGWRYVKTVDSDGTEKLKQIPLTLEDVHHPQEEDFIMQRPGHAEDCIYLHDVLQTHLGSDATVTFDLRIAWDTPVEPLGPDVTVIFGAEVDRNLGTFDCATEGRRPQVVFEVTSPSTRENDVGPKVVEYFLAGVEWYVIIDAVGFRNNQWDLRLLGYRHPAGEDDYANVPLNERGWLWVEPLRVFVAVREGRVVCYNERGAELLGHRDLNAARLVAEQQSQASDQAKTRAEQQRDDERRQRETAEKAQLDSEQAKVRAEQEKTRAEQQRDDERRQREMAEKAQQLAEQAKVKAEQAKAEAEQAKTRAEQQRDAELQAAEAKRLALEERMHQMEDELRRLRGD